MQRRLFRGPLVLFATAAAVLTLGVASAGAADLTTNGSFETRDFTGWTTTDPGGFCTPWTVYRSPSSDWCFNGFDPSWPTRISAVDGRYFADVTWDGDGKGDALLSQAVSIPANTPAAMLSWSDNTSWDLTFGAHRARVEEVQILNSKGHVLQSYKVQTLTPGTIGATGWVAHTLDLSSSFAGQTVQIQFRLTIPEDFTGPANFAIDNVTLMTG
jgi:hypothetical protein